MDLSQDFIQLSIRLTEAVARNTASNISSRISASKANRDKDAEITDLREIIQSLLDDKQEISLIAEAYKEELVSQSLTSEDIDFIVSSVLPILEKVADSPDTQKQLEVLKPLLSEKMINVMQLIGFNFKKALGQPLTELVQAKILEHSHKGESLKKLELER